MCQINLGGGKESSLQNDLTNFHQYSLQNFRESAPIASLHEDLNPDRVVIKEIFIKNCTFENNGGVLEVASALISVETDDSPMVITDSIFRNNDFGGTSIGVLIRTSSFLEFKNNIVENNVVIGDALIEVLDGANYDISDNSFEDNSATPCGPFVASKSNVTAGDDVTECPGRTEAPTPAPTVISSSSSWAASLSLILGVFGVVLVH